MTEWQETFKQAFNAEFGYVVNGYSSNHIVTQINGLDERDWNICQIKMAISGAAHWAWKEQQKKLDSNISTLNMLGEELVKTNKENDRLNIVIDKTREISEKRLAEHLEAIKDIQSHIAVMSERMTNDDGEEVMAVDVNELASYIDSLIGKL